jgi:methionyl-tRNA synthetase
LFLSINFIRDAATYLFPITPNLATQLLSQVFEARNAAELSWENVGKFSVQPGTRVGKPRPLVEKISDDQINKDIESLEKGDVE